MKAIEQHFPVMLFIMPYRVVLTFESVDENLKCDFSIENCTCLTVLSCGADCFSLFLRNEIEDFPVSNTWEFGIWKKKPMSYLKIETI